MRGRAEVSVASGRKRKPDLTSNQEVRSSRHTISLIMLRDDINVSTKIYGMNLHFS